MKRSTKKFTAAVASVAVAGLAIGLALSLWTRPAVVVDHSAADTSSNTVIPMNTEQKTYDENNIGELYCKAVDEEHIGSSEAVQFMDDELLVVAQDGVAKSYIEELAEKYGAEIVGEIEQTGDYQWQISDVKTLDELKQLAEQVKQEEAIVSADVNYVSNIGSESVDYDINVGKEWSDDFLKGYDPLKNKVKLSADDKMWNMKAINAPMAWKSMELKKDNIEPVKVGLIDTGFDTKHEDLGFADNGVFYLNGANSNEDRDIDTNVKTEDILSHGTHVAGIMAAKSNNKDGICGVYPYGNSLLYGVSFWGSAKKTEDIYEDKYSENAVSSMIEKIYFSELILRNVKVINCSYGDESGVLVEYGNEKEKEAELADLEDRANLLGDFLNRLIDKGYDFVICSCAGNDSNNAVEIKKKDFRKTINTKNVDSKYASTLNYIKANNKFEKVPSRIIVVGAVDVNLQRSYYSNLNCDIYAPGGIEKCRIFSTVPDMENIAKAENYTGTYGYKMGTSMAAPHVAGVCADVWSIDNTLTGEKVKEIVCGSVTDASKKDYPVVDCFKAVEWAFKEKKENGGPVAEPLYGEVMGWVTDSSNKKLKGAVVTAVNKADKSDKTTVKTDSYGHFELLLAAGDYKLSVTKSGYQKAGTEVSVSGGEVNYLSDYIKLKKNLTKAEKYAKAVMDNEDMWLDKWNNSYIGSTDNVYCWFEDIDFDGDPEFIVGGALAQQAQGGINYDYFKVTDNGKLKHIVNANDPDREYSASVFANYAPNPGLGYIDAMIMKDRKTGEHIYTYSGTFPDLQARNIIKMDFSGGKYSEEMLCGYTSDDRFEDVEDSFYLDSSTEKISKSRLIAYLNDKKDNYTFSISSIGTIPCTWTMKNEVYYEGGMNDGAASTISNCYDGLSKAERKAALVKSFNKYSLTDTDDNAYVFDNMINALNNLAS